MEKIFAEISDVISGMEAASVCESKTFLKAASKLAGWDSDPAASFVHSKNPVNEFGLWILDVERTCNVTIPPSLLLGLKKIPEIPGLYAFLGDRANSSELHHLFKYSRDVQSCLVQRDRAQAFAQSDRALVLRQEAFRCLAIRSIARRKDHALLSVLSECISLGGDIEACEAIAAVNNLGESHLSSQFREIARHESGGVQYFAKSIINVSLDANTAALIELLIGEDERCLKFAIDLLKAKGRRNALPGLLLVLGASNGEKFAQILEIISSIAAREGMGPDSARSLIEIRKHCGQRVGDVDSVIFKVVDSSFSGDLLDLAREVLSGSDREAIEHVLQFISSSREADLGEEWFDLILENTTNVVGFCPLSSIEQAVRKFRLLWEADDVRLWRMVEVGLFGLVVRSFCPIAAVIHTRANAHRHAVDTIASSEKLSKAIAKVAIENRSAEDTKSVVFIAALREVLKIKQDFGDLDDELVKLVEQILYGGPAISESLTDSEVQELKSISPGAFQKLS